MSTCLVLAVPVVATVEACSAGGSDSQFWSPGGNPPPGVGGATGATTTTEEGSTTVGSTTVSSSVGNTTASSSVGSTTVSSSHAASSSSTSVSSSHAASSSSTSVASSSSSSSSGGAVTWTEIYDTMFGPSGTSTCVANGGCHTQEEHGFKCGTSASTCYQGFVSAGYITAGSGASQSSLVSPQSSPLCGSLGGDMPRSPGKCITAAQLTTIENWLATGAPDN